MKNNLRRLWDTISAILSIINQSRFSLIVVLIALIGLEYIGQLKDILVGLSHPENKLQVVFFILGVNWLAFQSWGWARYIYSLCYDHNGDRGEAGYQRSIINWLPRFYAIVTFFAAYRAAIRAEINNIAIGIVVVAVLVVLLLYFRRKLTRIAQPLLKHTPNRSHHYFTAVVMLITVSYALAYPVNFGNLLGAGAVIFFGLGSLIPVGTLLVSAARKSHFPVIGALIFFAVIISSLNDNHHVRSIEGQRSSTQNNSLDESLTAWLEQADSNKPMVLVATAGGGLRASYWTGVVLGRFQDLIPGFNKQVFAISGVSGGSVGAVFYNAALTDQSDCSMSGHQTPCFEKKLLAAIGRDYLAPTLVSTLYADLIQRFIPYPIFSDRATALEQSWEQGFSDIYPDETCGLDNNFMDWYSAGSCSKGQSWMPRLLINGTYQETGNRLLTTSFKVEPEVFLNTHDFNALNNGAAIRASTAALNSARFPYLSPAGTFGKDGGHILDGGYFENYGAATLTNVIEWLKRNDQQFSTRKIIVVGITNYSAIPISQFELGTEPATAAPQNFINEAIAPLIGLINTPNGHSRLAFKQMVQNLNRDSLGADAQMLHFYLTPNDEQPPPLGWILSKQAKSNMSGQLTKKHNCAAYQLMLNEFGLNKLEC